MKTLDQLFEEEAAKRGVSEDTPSEVARYKIKADAERVREIKQGLRDISGDWIEQPEIDDEDDEEDEE